MNGGGKSFFQREQLNAGLDMEVVESTSLEIQFDRTLVQRPFF